MQTKSRLFSIISSVLVIITMLFDINLISLYVEYDFLSSFGGVMMIVSFLLNIPLIVFLFMNNRKLATIPYALKVVINLIYIIRAISLYNVLSLIVEGAMLFILLSSTILTDKVDKKILKNIWFIPAVIWLLNIIIDYASAEDFYFSFSLFVQFLVILLSYLAIGFWGSDIYAPKVRVYENESGTYTSSELVSNEEGYCDLLTHILLLLFTFGIWQYIWIYKTTSYLNKTPNEEHRNPTTKLLLCMFVPFYYIYWTYKSAQRIDSLAISKGQQSDISTLCLILSIFVGIVPPILMQDKINNIARQKTTANVKTTPTQDTNTTPVGVADEIKKYKELLDTGVITEEEFEAKKKQLLGL